MIAYQHNLVGAGSVDYPNNIPNGLYRAFDQVVDVDHRSWSWSAIVCDIAEAANPSTTVRLLG